MNEDTISLLQECNAGAKMGIKSLNEVIDDVCDMNLKQSLVKSRNEHEKIQSKTSSMLFQYQEDGKEPAMMASAMSWMKMNAKMAMDRSDQTIANLITDGCNMGVTSLNRYLNEYSAADSQSQDIAKDLIALEEKLSKDLRAYL
jgi:hypothetical protein